MKIAPFFKAAVLSAFVAIAAPAFADDYSFVIHNKTDTKVVKVLVSEDKKEYAEFDLDGGIGAGKKATLVWDKSTNNQNCKQWIKVIYANGDESEITKFDFCEEDLVIELEE